MEVGRIGQGGQVNIDYTNLGERAPAVEGTKPVEAITVNAAPQKNGQDTPSEEEITKAVGKLNKVLEGENVHAEYEVHEKLKDVMIRIVNNDTKEVVLEIPPKKILDMVAKMMEMVGLLVDKKA